MPKVLRIAFIFVHIYISCQLVSEEYFFAHGPIKYKQFLNGSKWPINEDLTGTST